MIPDDVIESMEGSVLCWLATVSEAGLPNVSPKEAWVYSGAGKILVAHIASPVTVRNIERIPEVCLSFINIFLQKGYKITGKARVLRKQMEGFEEAFQSLTAAFGTQFPISAVIEIQPQAVAPIIAPSYRLFPDSGPLDKIEDALKTYRVIEYQKQIAERDAD